MASDQTPVSEPTKDTKEKGVDISNEEYQKLYEEQQASIKKEIEKEPLIGPLQDISSIFGEYANNKNFLMKICDLFDNRKKTQLRKIRKDGSCFYRGFIFRLAEILISNKNLFSYYKLFEKINKARQMMVNAGFEPLVFETFESMFKDFLSGIQSGLINSTNLQQSFDDKEMFDYYVMYLRFVISAYIRTNVATFELYFENEYQLLHFCQTEVEPIDSEADQIQIVAMFNYMGIPLRIFYIDNSSSAKVTCLSLPELDNNSEEEVLKTDGDYPIQLLYKPGHYDIVY